MSASFEGLAPSESNSGAMWPNVPPGSALVSPKDLLGTIAESPKSDIQARGGVSLLIRMLGCGSKLMELMLIVKLEKGKTIERSTHPF